MQSVVAAPPKPTVGPPGMNAPRSSVLASLYNVSGPFSLGCVDFYYLRSPFRLSLLGFDARCRPLSSGAPLDHRDVLSSHNRRFDDRSHSQSHVVLGSGRGWLWPTISVGAVVLFLLLLQLITAAAVSFLRSAHAPDRPLAGATHTSGRFTSFPVLARQRADPWARRLGFLLAPWPASPCRRRMGGRC